MERLKTLAHDKLRLWLMIIAITSIMLTHLSKALRKSNVNEIFGTDAVLSLRWWLYVAGCSV